MALHGPHQVAQKSTSTGTADEATSVWKFASVTSKVLGLAMAPCCSTEDRGLCPMLPDARLSSAPSHPRAMSLKVFFPQDVVDSWITSDKVELSGETMTFRGRQLSLRMVPGYYFNRVAGGSDDANQLIGRAKSKAALSAL